MTARQKAIANLITVRPHVARRARDPNSAPQWKLHLARNDRKLRWLRYLRDHQ